MPPKKELCRNFQRAVDMVTNADSYIAPSSKQSLITRLGLVPKKAPIINHQPYNSLTQIPLVLVFKVHLSKLVVLTLGHPIPSSLLKISGPVILLQLVESPMHLNKIKTSPRAQIINPNECKKLIAADFEDERPLWKLTCYGHFKHLPCDIAGDTSYEELRAAAYEDAKRGIPLQSIVERERSLQQSKLAEFESLLRNPYTKLQNSAQSLQNPFPSIASNSLSLATQKPSPSPFSSFGQPTTATQNPNPSPFSSFGQPTTTAQNSSPTPFSSFGQPSTAMQNPSPSPFSSFGQPATSFGMTTSTSSSKPPSNPFGFGQINNSSQPSTTSSPSSVTSANPGGGGPFSAFSTQTPRFGNSGMSNLTDSKPPTSLFPQNVNSTTNLLPGLSNASGAHGNGFGQMASVTQSLVNMPKESSAVDASIWLKEVWKLGEIPEDIPPVEYIR